MPCYLLVNKTGSGGASPKGEEYSPESQKSPIFSVVLLKRALFSKLTNLEIRVNYSLNIMLLGFPSSPEIRAIYLIVFARARVGTKKFERKCLAMRVDLTGKY